ncbi:MAG: sialate O-acetylesterase [Verrucomicrobia bacterium]|nr:sialate O-acetylesterase [Verrucomicrobiota bacterium]
MYLIGALALGFTTSAWADVVLPKVISDKMVLQRGVEAPIWGWADQGEEVTVTFAGQTKQALPDENGRWMVRLAPLAASAEPRVMTVQGSNSIQVGGVLVGEVWLASGQSNMEWDFNRVVPAEKAYAAEHASNALLRAFHVNAHIMAGTPLDDTVGWWKDCEEMVGEPGISLGLQKGVSAVGFFFALRLQEELGVPVAFIDANWGGQRIERFIPREGFEALGIPHRPGRALRHDAVERKLEAIAASVSNCLAEVKRGRLVPLVYESEILGRSDNGLYNAMIAPLTPFAIKGAVWYQGESNRAFTNYFELVEALSAGWSEVFGVEDIPLHQVQIAPCDYERDRAAGLPGPLVSTLADNIWQPQYRAAREIPGVSVVAIHDTNIDINSIHPAHKLPVGNRLAAMALREQYGKDIIASGPRFASATLEGATVVVSFTNIDQGLSTKDGRNPAWFELSADGEVFVAADAAIKVETVEVSTVEVQNPQYVRMGWYDTAIPTLQDKNGWPAYAFPAQPVE